MLQPILKTDRNNADAWWLLANALSDPEKQVQALNQVLRLRPNDSRAEKMLGRVQAEMRPKSDEFSFPVSDDDPFASTSSGSSNPFGSGRSTADDDPLAGIMPNSSSREDSFGSSDPFASGGKPKRDSYDYAPPPRTPERRGRNPVVTCLAIIGVLAVACCVLTFVVLPRVAGPMIEQIATQFPDIMLTITANPSFQDVFSTLDANGALNELNTAAGSGSFQNGGAVDRGKINVGQSISGTVDTFDDDYYALTISANQNVTIDVMERDGELDPQLYVYNASRELINSNDDISMSGGNFDSRLTVTLSPGTYYLVVSAFGNGGRYEIRVSG